MTSHPVSCFIPAFSFSLGTMGQSSSVISADHDDGRLKSNWASEE